jgi:hypothetical protein
MTEIFAGTEWYRARSGPEREWRGCAPGSGCACGARLTDRSHVRNSYQRSKHHPVYAANAGKQLAPYVGREVILRAKLVDLRGEGYGQELWIASIRAVDAK